MQIVIASATEKEIQPLIDFLDKEWEKIQFVNYSKDGIKLSPLVTGIGCMNTAFAISRLGKIQTIDLIIHLGVAGSYSRIHKIGELVEIISEQWGDLGAEDADGKLIDAFELGLMDKNLFPYQNGKILKSKNSPETSLKKLKGLSVNRCSGNEITINQILKRFDVDIENMEGIGLFYACRQLDIPFVSLRAISNYVEPRNKENWDINQAITKLNTFVIEHLKSLIGA